MQLLMHARCNAMHAGAHADAIRRPPLRLPAQPGGAYTRKQQTRVPPEGPRFGEHQMKLVSLVIALVAAASAIALVATTHARGLQTVELASR